MFGRTGLRLFALASACALFVVPAFAAKEKRKITQPTSELEGYFVRVKSGITGEKQIYYNKDGTLRGSRGDGLLGGDFSLDESLLGGEGLDLNLTPEEIPSEVVRAEEEENPSPPPVPAETEAVSAPPPRASVPARREEEVGVVDEDSLLRKFSERKSPGTFQVDPENFKKVLNAEADGRWKESISLREWQGGESAFGMRRFSSAGNAYAMRAAALGEGDGIEMGRFEAKSALAGERMFVRNSEGVLEVRINDRFSAEGRVRASARAKTVRESSGFSMQDINRYQFRRNRSAEPGLPVASPGSGGNVRRENFGGGKAKPVADGE